MKENQKSQFQVMTEAPIPGLILKLSVPAIITMLVTNIYNMVDTAFVGRLGTSASGAVGIVFGFMAILQAFGFMFGQGSGVIISRLLGKQESEKASEIASTAVAGAIICGVIFMILGFLNLDRLVMLLGSTDTIAPYAKTYISYILVAAPFITPSFTLNNVLRYEGKARLGMVGMLTGAILNMAGDPIFMFAMDMGIAGAGLSTAISQIIGFLVLLSFFFRGKTQLRLSLKNVKLNMPNLSDISTTGLPSLIRQILNSLATVVLNSCAQGYGDAAVAAMSIVSRIVFFLVSIALGTGQGYQPVSGFNYGAGRYSRLREGYRFTVIISEIYVIVLGILALLFSGSLIGLFRDDPEVIAIGTRALRLQCLTLPFLPFSMVTEMQLQSTGQKKEAALLSSLRSGLFLIPILVILSQVRGLSGIQEAQPLSTVITSLISAYFAASFFRRLPREDKI